MLLDQMGDMGSKVTYNEFVLSIPFYSAHLPSIVEAFMFVDDPTKAKQAQASYLAQYGYGQDAPLLRYVAGTGFVRVSEH